MTHEEQMALIRRKFALQVALGDMSAQQLVEETSASLAKRFDVSATWAGAALRNEERRRASVPKALSRISTVRAA